MRQPILEDVPQFPGVLHQETKDSQRRRYITVHVDVFPDLKWAAKTKQKINVLLRFAASFIRFFVQTDSRCRLHTYLSIELEVSEVCLRRQLVVVVDTVDDRLPDVY